MLNVAMDAATDGATRVVVSLLWDLVEKMMRDCGMFDYGGMMTEIRGIGNKEDAKLKLMNSTAIKAEGRYLLAKRI